MINKELAGMAILNSRRAAMTLFSSPNCPNSHRARLVLAEKGIGFDLCIVDPANPPEDFLELNPYQTMPTLVDRDLVLYNAAVITEYLDERFPHPPLMPVDPVSRARCRLAMYRIDNDWYSLLSTLQSENEALAEKARKELRDSLIASSEVFEAMPYFLSEEFSLVDCSLAPLLWRLQNVGVEIPVQAKAIHKYMKRVFGRGTFKASLSNQEREIGVF